MNPQANTATVSEMRALQQVPREQLLPDQAVDMFTERGFKLAQRIAGAFAASDAVPVQFRQMVEKKQRGGGSTWIENPAAMGNCLVAIETARAVGMSITAVMQHANIIEGRLTWSAQFVIAAINASGRFTPLRFQMRQLGRMKATYKEKQGWNDQKRGYDFVEKTVEVDNVECIAWALPKGIAMPAFDPEQMRKYTLLELVRAAGLPVVESAPVSMKLAVEEGWYAKSGSKWQTELRTLMLQYRAGTFFGRIHAPDIVMGMGPTVEERLDGITTTLDLGPDGQVQTIYTETVARRPDGSPTPPAEVVQVNATGEQQQDQQPGDAGDGQSEATAPESSASAAAPAGPQSVATPQATAAQPAAPAQQQQRRQGRVQTPVE